MYEVVNIRDFTRGIKESVTYIHSKWGNADNYNFYFDAVNHSSEQGKPLPRFYLLMKDEIICGCYALLTNDLISRQDLYPWLGCLFIEQSERGKHLGSYLLQHGISEAHRLGYETIYLTTDHDGYYEKYGWQRMEDGYDLRGNSSRIYMISTKPEQIAGN